jgi:hypothetical protein
MQNCPSTTLLHEPQPFPATIATPRSGLSNDTPHEVEGFLVLRGRRGDSDEPHGHILTTARCDEAARVRSRSGGHLTLS